MLWEARGRDTKSRSITVCFYKFAYAKLALRGVAIGFNINAVNISSLNSSLITKFWGCILRVILPICRLSTCSTNSKGILAAEICHRSRHNFTNSLTDKLKSAPWSSLKSAFGRPTSRPVELIKYEVVRNMCNEAFVFEPSNRITSSDIPHVIRLYSLCWSRLGCEGVCVRSYVCALFVCLLAVATWETLDSLDLMAALRGVLMTFMIF